MYIKHSESGNVGVWLSTRKEGLVVWNTDTNVQEIWSIDATTVTKLIRDITEPLPETEDASNEDEFSRLLKSITSPKHQNIFSEHELMLKAAKCLQFYTDTGCFRSKGSLEQSIKTVQEVLYHEFGDEHLGTKRDELLLFVHHLIPSIFWGAYWGFALAAKSKKEGEDSEDDDESEDDDDSKFDEEKEDTDQDNDDDDDNDDNDDDDDEPFAKTYEFEEEQTVFEKVVWNWTGWLRGDCFRCRRRV
jgi:hypothetical protein